MGWWDLEGGPLEKNWLKREGAGDAAANQLSRLAGLLTSFIGFQKKFLAGLLQSNTTSVLAACVSH